MAKIPQIKIKSQAPFSQRSCNAKLALSLICQYAELKVGHSHLPGSNYRHLISRSTMRKIAQHESIITNGFRQLNLTYIESMLDITIWELSSSPQHFISKHHQEYFGKANPRHARNTNSRNYPDF